MGLSISSGRKPRQLAPKGTHQARVCFIVDMGTQPGSKQYPDPKRKVRLGFQILGERTEDDKNIVTYREMTLSNSQNSEMMKMLEAGFGIDDGDYEIDNLLGKYCNLTIKHEKSQKDDRVYDKIVAYTEFKKGEKPVEKGSEPLVSFYLTEPFDQETFESLPDWIQTKIAGSPEYAAISDGGSKKKASGKKK